MRLQWRPENLSQGMAAPGATDWSGPRTVRRSYQEFPIILQERVAHGEPLPRADAG